MIGYPNHTIMANRVVGGLVSCPALFSPGWDNKDEEKAFDGSGNEIRDETERTRGTIMT
jgi:hypothetical protein